tara:strand:+ start:294 stop:461 length:168 start_codon:yes stop_codon:yes gene_type:complete
LNTGSDLITDIKSESLDIQVKLFEFQPGKNSLFRSFEKAETAKASLKTLLRLITQ